MVARSSKDERIEIRATSEEKRLLAEAARRERLDVTSFVMRAAIPAAQAVLARPETVLLTDAETAQLLDMLDHPPDPAAALVRAARQRLDRQQ